MNKNWLVVVNREHAKIFDVKGSKIEFLRKYENPDGGLRKRAFETDKPGMNRRNLVGSRNLHGMTGGKDPTKQIEEVFAAHLATILRDEFLKHEVMHVTIAAEPKMCGILRAAMGGKLLKTPIDWWQKDCGKLSNEKIEKMMMNMQEKSPIDIDTSMHADT